MLKHEKILFRFHSNIFDEEMVETLWAYEIDKSKGIYKIDNIPFYVSNVAPDDLILAEFDKKEKMLTFREVIEFSENSVVQVIIVNSETETNTIRQRFLEIGCKSEKMTDNYFSMEVPADINYQKIKTELEKLETSELIEYAEPTLSSKHKKDIS